ncbi:hypothetical protein GQ457_06G013930 [Hibiscus cannabinus]
MRLTPRVPCVGAGKVVRELRPTPRVPCVGTGKVVRELRPTPRVPCVGAGKLESVRGKRLTGSVVALVIGVSARRRLTSVCRLILFFSITYWRPLWPVQLRRRHQCAEVTDTHLPKCVQCGRHSLPVGRIEHSQVVTQETEDRKGTGRDTGTLVTTKHRGLVGYVTWNLCEYFIADKASSSFPRNYKVILRGSEYVETHMLAKAKSSDAATKGIRCSMLRASTRL